MKILAFDIGGTFIKYALMDEKSEFLDKNKVKTPTEGREQLIEVLADIYGQYSGIDGIAISLPGIIDRNKGYCCMGGALQYNNDFAMRDALYKRCPVPIDMENDAKCATMAEASFGALKDVDDGYVLLFGTMIGGGYVNGRKLIRGKHFSTGEVSYILTSRDSSPVKEEVFGNRCGTPRLCHMFAEAKGLNPSEVDGVRVFRAVNEKDPDALLALNAFCHEIAVQIFNLQTIIDPERFAIGGGISEQPAFTETIRRNLEELYAAFPYPVPHAEVVTCAFRSDANLIGALSCWLEKYA